ncbi:uncharacterized protein LOC141590912 [Silene latifolia]|uniref:uncharacterized protein LOC141590912 n=1 Tax=Silene latifolia TaxID=37657 RepID=UPI003D772D9B
MRIEDFDEEEEEEVLVTLGLVQVPQNNGALVRQVFPSKAGGVPAWLDPDNLPTGKACCCDLCGEPLQFLLQVYGPISEKESAFHRTLFVFMCLSMACLLRDQHEQWKRGPEIPSRSVKVFRCQLPLANVFYKCEPPRYDGSDMPLGIGAPLCAWCGTWKGDKICSSCKITRYCSEKHQAMHWREGHRLECRHLNASVQSPDKNTVAGGSSSNDMPQAASITLWPEYKILEEFESDFPIADVDEKNNLVVAPREMDETSKSMLDMFGGDDDKKSWAIFQERLARAPEQVLRYSRDEGAQPLWPTSNGRPSRADIPKCSYCKGAMNFEFQILPQLLYYFGVRNDVDSLDWATIVVYTCADSCDASVSYKQEFAWVQLNSQTTSLP